MFYLTIRLCLCLFLAIGYLDAKMVKLPEICFEQYLISGLKISLQIIFRSIISKKQKMNLIKILLIVLGTLSLTIGIIGIVVPGLPSTPFFLLTAGLYIKSSDKLYQKLTANKFIGAYISDLHTKKGMTRRAKLISIGIMWLMIAISCIFLINPFAIKVIVVIIGVIGTVVMGFIVSTVSIPDSKSTLS
jgi:uncharacterized membrane protein YbaN (DUF454 family)